MTKIEVLKVLFSLIFAYADVFLLNYCLKLTLNGEEIIQKKKINIIVFISMMLFFIVLHFPIVYFLYVSVETFLVFRYDPRQSLKDISKVIFYRLLIDIICLYTFEYLFDTTLLFNIFHLFIPLKILFVLTCKYLQCFMYILFFQKKYKININIRHFKTISFVLSMLYGFTIIYTNKYLFYFESIGRILVFTLIIYNAILIIFDKYQVKHNRIEREYAEKRKEFELIDMKNRLQEKYNKEIQEEQNNTRNIKHNLDNQLCSIYAYIECGENEEAMEYIESIRGELLMGQHTNYTGHIGADAILHEKLTIAKQLGIEVTEYYGIIDFGDVEPNDLTIVLGCALDNAIEAIQRMGKEHKRKLSVSIYNNGPYVTIGVGNSVIDGHNIDFDHSSKKNDEERHGYGVKDIKEIGIKYDGSAHYEVDDEFVLLNVILYVYR